MKKSLQDRAQKLTERGRPKKRKIPTTEEALAFLEENTELFTGNNTAGDISEGLGHSAGAKVELLLEKNYLIMCAKKKVRRPSRSQQTKMKAYAPKAHIKTR